MTKKTTQSYQVPALEKGLDLLEELSRSGRPMSLADLSRALEKSSSEIFRMVDCLERRRYIVKDDNAGNYSLSLKLFELAHTHSPVDQLLRAAANPMRELADDIRESVHISVLERGHLIVLAQADSPEKVRLYVEVGATFSPVKTNSGRLLLALLPPDRLAEMLESDETYLAMDVEERADLAATLASIREKGCAVTENESHIGVKDVAVPVGNTITGPIAALAVGYLTARKQSHQKELVAALRAFAGRINESLGLNVAVK